MAATRQDEVLAHRLGLVPLKIDPRRLGYKSGPQQIAARGPMDSLHCGHPLYITTSPRSYYEQVCLRWLMSSTLMRSPGSPQRKGHRRVSAQGRLQVEGPRGRRDGERER